MRDAPIAEGAPLCPVEALPPDRARGFEVIRQGIPLAILLVHHRGHFYAYRNSCPHTGVELNWQPDQFLTLDGQEIMCAFHAARFRIRDGACTWGPCNGRGLTPVEVEVRDGRVWLAPMRGASQ